MNNIEITKAYIRFREFSDLNGSFPETEMFDCAMRGFRQLNVEVQPYYWIDDIDGFEDLGPEVGVFGYIDDGRRALTKLGIKFPEAMYYPEPLKEFLGRKIEKTTLGEVRNSVEHCFVKPVSIKEFKGFVWRADEYSRRQCITIDDDLPVWKSEIVDFLSEYRCFILRDELINVKGYKGDWSRVTSGHVIYAAIEKMKGKSPIAYCLDWGVDFYGKTLLVEGNDAFSFGGYGLDCVTYVRMLSARWNEMAK